MICTKATHDALKASPNAWSQLELIGVQRIPADDTGPAEAHELRNCPCGSTLAISVAADH